MRQRISALEALAVFAVAAMPMCNALAEETDTPTNWYLTQTFGNTSYGATISMEYWAAGKSSGTKGESTTELDKNGNYFVTQGYQFTTPNIEQGWVFPGSSLTIGSSTTSGKLYLRQQDLRFENLILKRGEVIHGSWRSEEARKQVHQRNTLYGTTTVVSPKTKPVAVYSDQDRLWMLWEGKLIGDENAGLLIGKGSSTQVSVLVSITNAAAYYGDIVVTSKLVNTGTSFGSGLGVAGSIPGTIRVTGGSIIKPHSPTSVADLGALHMGEGTEMRFVYDSAAMTGGLIRVSNALTLPEKIIVQAFTGTINGHWYPPVSTTGEEVRSPFLVGPPNVRIDPKIFDFVPDSWGEPNATYITRCPQRVHFETETDPDTGRDTVYAVIEPIVVMTKQQSDVREKNKAIAAGSALTNKTFWSDGRIPHANAHYIVTNYLVSTINSNAEYVFPGKSLLFYNGSFNVFGGNHRLNIQDFQMAGVIRQGQGSSVTICGGRVRLCDNGATMRAYADNTLTIESEIVGTANLSLEGETSTGSPHGGFAFKGFNTNWYGRITVTAPENSTVDDWSKDFLSLYLYDGRNLGGKLTEFNYKALNLGRYCELHARTNATLDASMNRGIFTGHEKGARIRVDEGYTLNCHWPITFYGPLYKMAKGTLALGGGVKFYDKTAKVAVDTLPEDASKCILQIRAGTVKALTHDCINGLKVDFYKASAVTSLAVDFVEEAGDLKKYGFYNVKTETPFMAGLPINIHIDNIDENRIRELKEYKQGLITVTTTAANTLGLDSLIKFARPFASGSPNVRMIREDDSQTGLTTYSAYYKFVGTQIILR